MSRMSEDVVFMRIHERERGVPRNAIHWRAPILDNQYLTIRQLAENGKVGKSVGKHPPKSVGVADVRRLGVGVVTFFSWACRRFRIS